MDDAGIGARYASTNFNAQVEVTWDGLERFIGYVRRKNN